MSGPPKKLAVKADKVTDVLRKRRLEQSGRDIGGWHHVLHEDVPTQADRPECVSQLCYHLLHDLGPVPVLMGLNLHPWSRVSWVDGLL